MKLITRFELGTRSTDELRALIRDLFNQLARSAPEVAGFVRIIDGA
jgi:hypothetical protein